MTLRSTHHPHTTQQQVATGQRKLSRVVSSFTEGETSGEQRVQVLLPMEATSSIGLPPSRSGKIFILSTSLFGVPKIGSSVRLCGVCYDMNAAVLVFVIGGLLILANS